MKISDIFLVIISSAGLLHGILFAFYLFFFKKKKTLSNYLLGFILVFMAFRIGKSILLNFGNDLEPLFIFIGLSFLLIIGPLLKYYLLAMTHSNFKLVKHHFLELIPFLIVFIISLFMNKDWFVNNNKNAIIVFGSILIFIYLHFAFYILTSAILLQKIKKDYKSNLQTKFQKVIFDWLNILIFGFGIIWVSFFLNIIDDKVPYIVGPIMYSIAIYFLSYKAFKLKVLDIDGEVFKTNNNALLFSQISSIVIEKKLYLESDVSLYSLSKLIGETTQKTSEIINQYGKNNFNDFINYFRIEEAKKLLSNQNNKSLTISSIAFDAGFSSLSSFNGAFKKFVGVTPSVYKKNNVI